jgi:hypothetical protein
MTTLLNAVDRSRRTLAKQIDRLDGIRKTVTDELAETVADVLQAAITGAVVAALADPAVIDQLRAAIQPGAVPTPTQPQSGQERTGGLAEQRKGAALHNPSPRVQQSCGGAWTTAGALGQRLWRARASLLLALLVAATFVLLGHVTGPVGTAILLGIGGIALTLLALLLLALWWTVPHLSERSGTDPRVPAVAKPEPGHHPPADVVGSLPSPSRH